MYILRELCWLLYDRIEIFDAQLEQFIISPNPFYKFWAALLVLPI